MSDETQAHIPSDLSREERLEQVLAEYLRQVEQGAPVDQQALLAAHPDLADDLREFFGNQMRMQRLVGVAAAPTSRNGTPSKLRYFGDYEILEEIAHGGMGVVYKARQTSLNRIVAVKMILAGQLANESDVKRFQAEAEAAANLHHPGIVGIYEVGLQDGQHYYSMEYIDGKNLAQLVRENPLPIATAAEYVRDIATVLEYAHQQNVLHRDLKPSNILLDASGRVRITDFGLAKRVEGESDLTMTGQVLGTPSYMSPEQAAAQHAIIGPPTDIYALGAILYELVTGRPPFRSENVGEVLRQVQHDEPVRPRLLNPKLPRDLETICLKCLEKEPRRRYGSAQLMADDLGRYLRGEPILARPVGTVERTWRWCQRNPVVSGLMATVAASLIVGTSISTYFAIESGRRANENFRLAGKEKDARVQAERRKTQAENSEKLAEKRRTEAEDNARLARRHLYVAHMSLVQNAWEDTRAGAVQNLLEFHRPKPDREDLRGFEWYYWNRLSNSERMTLRGHTAYIWSLAVSPDGKRIATGSNDRTVKVWDTVSGLELLTLTGHQAHVVSVSFSPDGKRIASASYESVKFWDTDTGRETLTLQGTPTARSIAFSPDGKRIATGGYDGSVKVWDTTSGREVATTLGCRQMVMSVAFSPDGTQFASAGNEHTIRLWDASTGKEIRAIPLQAAISSIAFSPDGTRITSGNGDGTLTIWDVATGRQSLVLKGHKGRLMGFAYNADGTRIASASEDQTVKLWETATGREIGTHKGHSDKVTSVGFGPNGAWVASAGFDQTLKLWDAFATENRKFTGHRDLIEHVAFSSDGTRIASASSDHTVKIWDATNPDVLLTLKGHTGGVFGVTFSPNGKLLASASYDQTVKLWDATSGQETLTLKGHTKGVLTVAFSPNGTRLASAGWDGTAKVWDATNGKEIFTVKAHNGNIHSVAFSPDGLRFVSGSWDGTVKIWNAITGQQTLGLKGHTSNVRSVAYSPDGTQIATGGFDGIVRLWNANTGEMAFTFPGHTGTVTSVAFSRDGTRIAAANFDKTVKLWDLATGQETITLKGHFSIVSSVAISPDGTRIASGSWDNTMLVWDAPRVGSR